MKTIKKYRYKIIAAVIVLITAIITAIGIDKPQLPNREGGVLSVHFIDVGEGDCAYIELPDGKNMLIDAGETEKGEDVSKYIKDRGAKRIDFVVGTHPHSDHIGGLAEIVKEFDIGKIYMPKVYQNSKALENVIIEAKAKGKKIISPMAGTAIFEDEELSVRVLSPRKMEYSSINDYSIVIKIVYKSKAFLFTGDAENAVLREIDDDVGADVLKVSHHGSDTSGDKAFMERVSPNYAIISVGEENQYNHPHKEILELLSTVNASIYRTDESGTIVVSSDGEKIEIVTLGGRK